ncbi:MAG: 2,3-bisphosphoglycerate-independent phosphoglycerate mutase [Candidatus Dependentiae bacterium]
MKNSKKPVVLVILDGFGHRAHKEFNAIAQAKTDFLNNLIAQYPHTYLKASGEDIGLLKNFIGNSEAGHQTIGAGRIIPQPVSIIHQALSKRKLCSNKKLAVNLHELSKNSDRLHIIGLLSDAGVHSHQELLYALIECAIEQKVPHIYLHLILDGRDTPPQSATKYLQQLEKFIQKYPTVSIASLHGRFYAMDRDNNSNRTKKSFDTLTQATVPHFNNWEDTLNHWYNKEITDEYIPPTLLNAQGTIEPGDGIICFNFRADRARQLTKMLLEHKDKLAFSFFITPFLYNEQLHTLPLFEKPSIANTFGDILHKYNKTILAIAETEKYAHVTYFFNSGRETPYATETWKLIPSIKTETYASCPEMSAPHITQTVLDSLKHNPKDFYLINYANADMVGHSGDFQATVKAIECLDKQLHQLYQQVVNTMNGTLIITADHGNAEEMLDVITNQPKTSHTTNKVPFIVTSKTDKNSQATLNLKSITDIAPYILKLMHLPIPPEMQH